MLKVQLKHGQNCDISLKKKSINNCIIIELNMEFWNKKNEMVITNTNVFQ